ncbi:efflux RND transporter permease subunit [Psychromonas hadalis]|uniref:efflux RND transporter permease subunit n=1 Tax=Psychromonas hadalis TaxID=211669 RepID=UPI0003B7190F|nr:efflux RND transporter permease subunit [Psychromonas hadalis]
MIRFFTSHPTAANLLMLTLMVLGILSLPQMQRETFPNFKRVKIEIAVPYPGASPENVEQALCLPIEDALDGINHLHELTCQATEGMATTIAEMERETGDVGRFIADIRTEIEAINSFPDQVEKTIISQQRVYDAVVSVGIASDMGKVELKEYVEQFKQRIKRLEGIALVKISGFSEPQLRIELNLQKLRQLNLTVADVAKSISEQNITMPSGQIYSAERTLLLRFDAQKETPRELANITIFSDAQGATIKLGDIATISRRFELDEESIEINDQSAALLEIQKKTSADAINVYNRVVQFVEREQHALPEGVHLTLTRDMASLAGDRINLLVKNGAQGILLVFLVMWLFFPWRYAFWVSMGLPVSFLASLFVMSKFGLSLNMLSSVALLIAIGLIMDDAIVLSESIATELEKQKDKLQAIVDGVDRVKVGVFSSFLTTLAIFGSLAFIEGDMGKVLKVVPIVLVITLVVSLIEAFFILPRHLYHAKQLSDDKDHQPIALKRYFNNGFESLREKQLPKLVGWIIDHRYPFSGAIIFAFLATMALPISGILTFSPFPELEGNQLQITLLMPPGTPFADTQKMVEKIEKDLKTVNDFYQPDQPQQLPLIANKIVQYGFNVDASEKGEHAATIYLDLLDTEIRHTLIADFQNKLITEIGELTGISSFMIRVPEKGPAGRKIQVELSHPDLQTLKQAGQEFALYLSQFDGVFNLLPDLRDGKPEILMQLLPGVESYGVTGQVVANQLRSAFFGIKVDELQIGGEKVELDLRIDYLSRSQLATLEDFPIILPDGRQIPLANLVSIDYQRGVNKISRVDNLRRLTLLGDIDTRINNTAVVMGKVKVEFIPEIQKRFPGLIVHLGGEAESSAETGRSMLVNFSIGLFAVFAILSYQFRSYVEPVIVMIAIPLSLFGVIWGHFLLGHNLTMPSMLGFASLSGIVVNDSILLVQFIKEDLKIYGDIKRSAMLATQQRVRAIFITSATTSVGLLPLLLEQSLQAQILIPLVIALVFGLLAATTLIILVLPAFYAILDDFKLTERFNGE